MSIVSRSYREQDRRISKQSVNCSSIRQISEMRASPHGAETRESH